MKLKIHYLALLLAFFSMLVLGSCDSNDEPPMRTEEDILGIWRNDNRYMDVQSDYRAYNLLVEQQNGTSIGRWSLDGFFYEPGYKLVVYMGEDLDPTVYAIVELTETTLIWCPVDSLKEEYDAGESIGQIIGEVIKRAQNGYKVNPELYEYFEKISAEEYFRMLEELNIFYPWD